MSDYTELVKLLLHCASDKRMCCVGCDYENERHCREIIMHDAAAAIEALQADVKRLKDCNDELREAQTYIDHYGDKWLTSAKDVPTSAYNHGYMDGKNEAEQELEPKRGEWKRLSKRCYYCSVCEDLWSVDSDGELKAFSYCPSCGAKTEVQE